MELLGSLGVTGLLQELLGALWGERTPISNLGDTVTPFGSCPTPGNTVTPLWERPVLGDTDPIGDSLSPSLSPSLGRFWEVQEPP